MIRPVTTYASSQTQTKSTEFLETSVAAPIVPAKEIITYSTGVQTADPWPLAKEETQSGLEDDDGDYNHTRTRATNERAGCSANSERKSFENSLGRR